MTTKDNVDQSDQIELCGLLTRDEVLDSFWRFRKATTLALAAIKCFIVFGLVGIGISAGVAFKFMIMPGILPIVGLVLAVIILVGLPLLATKIYLWSERTGYYYDTIPFYRDQIEYVIGPPGIAAKGTDFNRFYPWKELKQVFETSQVYIVAIDIKGIVEKLTSEKLILVVPKRFFKDPAQILQMTKLLRGGIAEYSIMKR